MSIERELREIKAKVEKLERVAGLLATSLKYGPNQRRGSGFFKIEYDLQKGSTSRELPVEAIADYGRRLESAFRTISATVGGYGKLGKTFGPNIDPHTGIITVSAHVIFNDQEKMDAFHNDWDGKLQGYRVEIMRSFLDV